MTTAFPYCGKEFTIKMDNGLEVKNSYHNEKNIVKVEFLNGDLKDTVMNIPFKWRQLTDGYFMISWQESDNNTVVHCDNFDKKSSFAYYTTMQGDFYVMEGKII